MPRVFSSARHTTLYSVQSVIGKIIGGDPISKSELLNALTNSYMTQASVKSQSLGAQATEIATEHWTQKHKGSQWYIITIDLTLTTHLAKSLGTSTMATKYLGVLNPLTLQSFNQPNTLIIYTSDRYTEQWVHALVAARTTHPSARVLNIIRDDSATDAIDLGELNSITRNPKA